jgi:hypothetical protein
MMMTGLMWRGHAADKDDRRGVDAGLAERPGVADQRKEAGYMSLSELLYYVLVGEGRVAG